MGPEGEGAVCAEDGRGVGNWLHWREGGGVFGRGEEIVEMALQGCKEIGDSLGGIEFYERLEVWLDVAHGGGCSSTYNRRRSRGLLWSHAVLVHGFVCSNLPRPLEAIVKVTKVIFVHFLFLREIIKVVHRFLAHGSRKSTVQRAVRVFGSRQGRSSPSVTSIGRGILWF